MRPRVCSRRGDILRRGAALGAQNGFGATPIAHHLKNALWGLLTWFAISRIYQGHLDISLILQNLSQGSRKIAAAIFVMVVVHANHSDKTVDMTRG
jgi:hypothetical protein